MSLRRLALVGKEQLTADANSGHINRISYTLKSSPFSTGRQFVNMGLQLLSDLWLRSSTATPVGGRGKRSHNLVINGEFSRDGAAI